MNLSPLSVDPSLLAMLHGAYGSGNNGAAPSTTVTVGSVDAKDVIAPKLGRSPSLRGRSAGERAAKATPILTLESGLPKAGSITAEEFLVAVRDAGKRQAFVEESTPGETTVDEATGEILEGAPILTKRLLFAENGTPVMVTDEKIMRADQKLAIAGLIGYFAGEAHGTQLDRATMRARAILRRDADVKQGLPVGGALPYRSPEAHAARTSASGFVAGLPNAAVTLLNDLKARHGMAQTDILVFETLIESHLEVQEAYEFETQDAADASEKTFTRLLNKEFPKLLETRAVQATDKDGALRIEKETGEPIMTEVSVEVLNPVAAQILAHEGEARTKCLKLMLALAQDRLAMITADLACSEGEPTVEQIEKMHAAVLGRGAPIFEDSLSTLVGRMSK